MNTRLCSNCNKEVEIKCKNRLERKNIFCNLECKQQFAKNNQNLNVICSYCNKKFHLKPYRIKRAKNLCCSYECNRQLRKITMKGENNHQYGLKGSLNSSWVSDERITNYGYKKIRVIDHPFRDCSDFVFEHRLIAEKFMLNDTNSVVINDKKYLNPDLVVHHIDFNKLNNDIENLKIMTLEEHTTLHNKTRDQRRDKNGKYCR